MFGGFQPLAFQPAFQQIRVTAGTAAGRRRRRRYYVEIDGERFLVDTAEEAAALLAQAATLAAKAADIAAQAVVEARLPRVRRLAKVARISLRPRIATDVPQTDEVQRARAAIQRIYDEAAQRAELLLLLERQAVEQDEQDIEDLIAMGEL